jgi:flagellar motility protein MotE (MotC chaperone)
MISRQKLRVIPLLIVVAGLAFTVRVGDFVHGLGYLGAANAAQEESTLNAAPPPAQPPSQAAAAQAPAPDNVAPIEGRLDLPADAPPPTMTQAEQRPWRDASDTEIESSAVREEIYKDLAERRATLERREKEIAVREALLSAAERELDQKLRELKTISADIQGMMKKISDEEEARINSLVKIYETMKPKDAASIFNTLDLDVLMEIITRMSERRSSPIIAQMNPDRARTITVMMSERKNTPDMPDIMN